MSKIGRFTFTNIPYIRIYDGNMIKYYYINGKVVRADSVSLFERIKRARKSYCLWTWEERCKELKMWNEYYDRIRCSYCICKMDEDCGDSGISHFYPSIYFGYKPKKQTQSIG